MKSRPCLPPEPRSVESFRSRASARSMYRSACWRFDSSGGAGLPSSRARTASLADSSAMARSSGVMPSSFCRWSASGYASISSLTTSTPAWLLAAMWRGRLPYWLRWVAPSGKCMRRTSTASAAACHMAAWWRGRLPTPLGWEAPWGYALRSASTTSCDAWKEHAAWRGRLPRSLTRAASSGNWGVCLFVRSS